MRDSRMDVPPERISMHRRQLIGAIGAAAAGAWLGGCATAPVLPPRPVDQAMAPRAGDTWVYHYSSIFRAVPPRTLEVRLQEVGPAGLRDRITTLGEPAGGEHTFSLRARDGRAAPRRARALRSLPLSAGVRPASGRRRGRSAGAKLGTAIQRPREASRERARDRSGRYLRRDADRLRHLPVAGWHPAAEERPGFHARRRLVRAGGEAGRAVAGHDPRRRAQHSGRGHVPSSRCYRAA